MKNLIENSEKYIMNTYNSFPIVLDRGEGCYLYDKSGKKYLDFVSGIAVNTLGYNNSKIEKTVLDQIKKIHHCSNLYLTEPNIELAKKLVMNSDFDKVFFCNSGTESIEGAIKLVRKYSSKNYNTDRYEIITMKNSFHGRTIGSVTATGQEKYQKGFGPLLPDIKHVEYNNIDSLKGAISDKTCAVILEVIQGEGGILPGNIEYLKEVRKLTAEKDIVLVVDEVQTGIGRTGKLFAYEYFGISPDIVCIAKGIAGGIPMGAVLAKENIANSFEPGDHAATFGGNPLSSAVALTVLEELIDNKLLGNVQKQGKFLKERLAKLKENYDFIKDVRGYGLMVGMEVEIDKLKDILNETRKEGLLLISAGSNVIRFVPPLIIDEKEINKGMDILERALKKIDN